jgi:hypothetical protein
MVARRLMIAMLVMLAIASLTAVLLPDPAERDDPTTTTGAPRISADQSRRGAGRLVRATLEASVPRPRMIRVDAGDQLALRVEADRAGQVEIGGFGQLEDVYPPAPARFNLLMNRPGTFPVRLLDPARTIGKIVVQPQDPKSRRR